MNIIQKIESSALANGLQLNISGDKRTRILYGKVYDKPYKIISPANHFYLFASLCTSLVQNKQCEFISYGNGGYKAFFTEGNFKVEVQNITNGSNIICIYKIK